MSKCKQSRYVGLRAYSFPNVPPSLNSSSIQFVIISWSGGFKCILLELDPIHFFVQLKIRLPLFHSELDQFLISVFNPEMCQFRSRKSHPQSKSIVYKLLLLNETGCNVLLFFCTGLRVESHPEGLSSRNPVYFRYSRRQYRKFVEFQMLGRAS